jgi:hypothetical protein
VLPATAAEIQKYLGSGLIKGIGPVMAERMVAHFGVDIMHVIEDEPGRLIEVDAVVGPAFRTVELQVTAGWAEQSGKSAAGHLNAGLSALFPWLKVDAGMQARKAATRTRQDGQSITLQPVDSAARQLVQLSLHYLVNQPERICVVDQNTPFPGAEAIAVGAADDRVRRRPGGHQVLAAGCRAQ